MDETLDERDRMAPEAREAALFGELRRLVGRARAEQPFWAERLSGIAEAELGDRDALARLPVLRKADLPALQAKTPPFGGLTATPTGGLARLFISPGPIFDPEGRGEDWWGAARALRAAGLKAGDIVLNTFSYHLTPAGAMFETGARAVGCAVIPAGPGNTADQLLAIGHYRPAAYVGTPDFLKILLDKGGETGGDVSSIRLALVSGAALPASLAAEFQERGITVRQCYGTADLGIVAFETGEPGMAVNEDIIVEIVRPGTGDPVPAGEVGEVVVTRLNADYPLFRFATGDLSAILTEAVAGGRTNMRIRGWMGRADQTTKVKGMFVRPEQVAAIGRSVPGLGRLRLVVGRVGEQDRMTLIAEHDDAGVAPGLQAKLVEVTRLRGEVEIVAKGTLPNDGKLIADER